MRYLVFAFALSSATLGCSTSTDATFNELTGSWQTARESLSPAGSYQTTLTFAADGGVTVDVRSYGLYPGQQPDDLAAYSRSTGSYRVADDSLTIHPERLVTWDRFYGANSPEHVEEISGHGSIFWGAL